MLHDIFQLYRNGDVIVYILFALLCVGYVIIFEKFIILQFVYRINFEKYNTQLKKMLLANDLDRARSLSRATSKTGVPMLVFHAIECFESDPMRVRSNISEEGLRFFPRIRRRLSQLPNLAATSVVFGAVATVHGVWASFQLVDGLEFGIKSMTFANGLTQAMLPIAISLVIAIALMLPFGILDAIAWRLESEIELSLCIVLNILAPEFPPSFPQNTFDLLDANENKPEKKKSTHASDHPPQAATTEDSNQALATKAEEGHNVQAIPDEEEII